MVSEETMRWFAEWVVLGSFVMAFLIATVRSVNLREVDFLYDLQMLFVWIFWLFILYLITGLLIVFVLGIWYFAILIQSNKEENNVSKGG